MIELLSDGDIDLRREDGTSYIPLLVTTTTTLESLARSSIRRCSFLIDQGKVETTAPCRRA
jgi:hypothetical protein